MKKISIILLYLLTSCVVIQDYKYVGQETISGTIDYEYQLHEHFKDDNNSYNCFYYHDTITEDWEISIDDFVKIRKLKWKKYEQKK